jgi:hypothetical protein
VVPAAIGQPGNGVFAALCLLLLVGGLFALLMLNTAMAEGSFTQHQLQSTSGELTDTEQALTQAIDAQRSPGNLAARATRLGMVPAGSAAFLRLSDGAVLGVATPARKRPGFTVVAAPRSASSATRTATTAGPRTSVSTKGDVTTTTTVVTKPDGSVVTTVTSADAATGETTSTTHTTRPATAAATTPTTTTPTTTTPPTR